MLVWLTTVRLMRALFQLELEKLELLHAATRPAAVDLLREWTSARLKVVLYAWGGLAACRRVLASHGCKIWQKSCRWSARSALRVWIAYTARRAALQDVCCARRLRAVKHRFVYVGVHLSSQLCLA